MITKKQLIVFVMLVALTMVGVLNLDTVRVSAAEFPAIYISPALVTIEGCSEIGSNYTFSICTDYNGSDICGYEFELTYDPNVLEGVNVTNGDLITEAKNTTMWLPGDWNNTVGTLSETGANFQAFDPPSPVTSGPGILANVTFTVVGCGISSISFVESETRLIGYNPEHPRADQYGYYNIIDEYWPHTGHIEGSVFDHSASRDVAIIDVSPNQTVVAQGFDLGINVTAENQGQSLENFTVTAYANTTVIQTENVTDLANGTSTTLTFTWNTTGILLGNYTISANASIVADETDIADNTNIFGTVTVALPGSVDVTNVDVSHGGNLVNQAYKTWTVDVSVTVHNNGSVPINCPVTAYYYTATSTHQIGLSQNVNNLDPGNTTTLIFTWNFLTLPVGINYTVKANATCTVGGASDEFVNGLMEKIPWGDVNNDGKITGGDVGKLDLIYSDVVTGPPDLVARGDINGDCKLTGGDVGKLDLIYSGVIS
jgi:hypothetical protein